MLRSAYERDFLFDAHSFLRDYPPVGPWRVEAGIAPAPVQALINLWPCSGLLDEGGQLKPALAPIVVPEPGVSGLVFGLAGLLIAHRRRGTGARQEAPSV